MVKKPFRDALRVSEDELRNRMAAGEAAHAEYIEELLAEGSSHIEGIIDLRHHEDDSTPELRP